MKHLLLFFSFFLTISILLPILADEIMTPVGVAKIQCIPDSDTIVGLPLRRNADYNGHIYFPPDTTTINGSAILTMADNPEWAPDQFAGTHYVKFKNSSLLNNAKGQWFTITSNSANTLTADLNGSTIHAVDGDSLEVIKFWTLDELFPPTQCTADAATTGNAIVASTDSVTNTYLLIPDLVGEGINLSATKIYFVKNGSWIDSSDFSIAGNTQLWPDAHFTIRHGATISQSTTYTSIGEVELGDFDIQLNTNTTGRQDNFVAIPRPKDVTLNELNLGGTSAFTSSTSSLPADREDELLLFDNSQAMINKSPSETYFYLNGAWRAQSNINIDSGSDIISTGAGFIIRKAQTVDGATHIWKNTPSYTTP